MELEGGRRTYTAGCKDGEGPQARMQAAQGTRKGKTMNSPLDFPEGTPPNGHIFFFQFIKTSFRLLTFRMARH